MATPLLVVGPHQVGQNLRDYKIADFVERCNNSMLKDRGYANVTPERFTIPNSGVVQHVFFYTSSNKNDMLHKDEIKYICDLYRLQGWRAAAIIPYQLIMKTELLGEYTGFVQYALANTPEHIKGIVERFPENAECMVLMAGASIGNLVVTLNSLMD